MKVICIEEHVTNVAIDQASHSRTMAEASYFADWGTRMMDNAEDYEHDRPLMTSLKYAKERVADVGLGRIAEMDKHAIDMQVLSYASSPQLAPADQALELSREANDLPLLFNLIPRVLEDLPLFLGNFLKRRRMNWSGL
jgi:predicted TIM-barrel fold metal-dependent hydrolase